jgi:hypothetical protein
MENYLPKYQSGQAVSGFWLRSCVVVRGPSHPPDMGIQASSAELLQKEHADNFMMHLLVENVEAWWSHVQVQGLVAKYGVYVEPLADRRGASAISRSLIRPGYCGALGKTLPKHIGRLPELWKDGRGTAIWQLRVKGGRAEHSVYTAGSPQ